MVGGPILQRALKLVKAHEGLELKPYTDTVGKLTIGYGRNLSDRGLSEAEAEHLLINDLRIAEEDARSLSGPIWDYLSLDRKAVLVDMAFNLGKQRLKGFKRMWAALYNNNYDEAAKEMLDSYWAMQVGQRALNLANIMRGS